MHTVYLKWGTNKDLLWSTGNSAQCYVAAWVGGAWGRVVTCIMYGWVPLLSTWSCHNIPQYKIKSSKTKQNKKNKGWGIHGKRVSVLVFNLLPYVFIFFLIYPSNTFPRKKKKNDLEDWGGTEGPGLALWPFCSGHSLTDVKRRLQEERGSALSPRSQVSDERHTRVRAHSANLKCPGVPPVISCIFK